MSIPQYHFLSSIRAYSRILCFLYLFWSLQPWSVWGWGSPNLQHLLLSENNEWAINTTIAFPDEARFSEVTERWTNFEAPTYSAAISPATEEDVVKVVQLATKHGIPFLATGGRHGYTTTQGRLQKGLAVDLSLLKLVKINESTGRLTVGGGTRWSEVLDPIYDAGFVMQIGSCSCPGMVGATIGGGVGRFSGRFGLIIDALVSVRIVTADGQLLHVSKTSHPDLFWGIRGAGGNFGIITSATYALKKLADNPALDHGNMVNADFIIPAEMSGKYFDILQSFNHSIPAGLAVGSIIMYNDKSDTAQILANWVYIGSEADGMELLSPILELQPPVSSVNSVPFNKILSVQGFGMVDPMVCQNGLTRSIYSANFRQLTAKTYQTAFEKMTHLYAEVPNARGSILELSTFPHQAAAAISDDETAYPWRDAKGSMMLLFTWNEEGGQGSIPEAVHRLGRELRSDFAQTSGYADLSVYISYARGDETLEQIYGVDKLPRLAALKEAWDPRNVFAFNNALPKAIVQDHKRLEL